MKCSGSAICISVTRSREGEKPSLGTNEGRMEVIPVPCLDDNYAYLIIDGASKQAAAVDPVKPESVLSAAKKHGAQVTMVLTTHKHWDHAGGNNEIKKLVPGIKVFGGAKDNVEGCTDPLEHGAELELSKDVKIKALHTPCHTKGHISYFVTHKSGDPAVFTGDTLFVAGCGKFFEGKAQDMYHSLSEVLAELPPATRVFCGHEYTAKNLKFAMSVDPHNDALKQKVAWTEEQRRNHKPTVPSTIREELQTNPFMRVNVKEFQVHMGESDPVELLASLRAAKDQFKG
ncbi:hydroxyacylglutathione hydrolase cytoplasmic-like [Selaginella moellendorffii]|uniref:hydroxyacylglutathione hydrolase cytoplasmic-like n=1 Tax=Selaginella moellendorffii TaxID=88036 RepID=UPI000D1D11A9|nr:hydroxyacylglutathione hydrolase cytoplasmic-like [Selaginella moellendorffii]|eukprot:XP_024529553.1 hydroxyacylglutathione hydrolase cytoplasmic-like [Selaginella moellendorffii]